jgi:hypothetical protein
MMAVSEDSMSDLREDDFDIRLLKARRIAGATYANGDAIDRQDASTWNNDPGWPSWDNWNNWSNH